MPLPYDYNDDTPTCLRYGCPPTASTARKYETEADPPILETTANMLKEWQIRWTDKRTATQRRRDRVPLQARDMYKQAAETNKPKLRAELRQAAWQVIREHQKRIFETAQKQRPKHTIMNKQSNVKHITALKITDDDGHDTTTTDETVQTQNVKQFFERKWQCDNDDCTTPTLSTPKTSSSSTAPPCKQQ